MKGDCKLNIGIAWLGNRDNPDDTFRSCPVIHVQRLIDDCSSFANFFSLQPDLPRTDIAQLNATGSFLESVKESKTFAETAALMGLLDLVVSVDTSVAHLAGGMGIRLWVLTRRFPDWRWREAARSDWYPQAEVFSQSTDGDWGSAIELVRAKLVARKSELKKARCA